VFERRKRLNAWDRVAVEVPYGSFRFDVAIMASAGVVYGFEVYFRHAVPETKASELGVPWMELDADEILRYGPRIPIGAASSGERCPRCQFGLEQVTLRAADDSVRSDVGAAYERESLRVGGVWTDILAVARAKSSWKRNGGTAL